MHEKLDNQPILITIKIYNKGLYSLNFSKKWGLKMNILYTALALFISFSTFAGQDQFFSWSRSYNNEFPFSCISDGDDQFLADSLLAPLDVDSLPRKRLQPLPVADIPTTIDTQSEQTAKRQCLRAQAASMLIGQEDYFIELLNGQNVSEFQLQGPIHCDTVNLPIGSQYPNSMGSLDDQTGNSNFIELNTTTEPTVQATPHGPHRCTYPGCTKTYKALSDVDKHMHDEHFGANLYPCKHRTCNAAFETLDAQRVHEFQAHHNSKLKSCTECGDTFTGTSALRKHMGLHSGKRACPCDLCTISYDKPNALTKHKRRAHPNNQFFQHQDTLEHTSSPQQPDGYQKPSNSSDSDSVRYNPDPEFSFFEPFISMSDFHNHDVFYPEDFPGQTEEQNFSSDNDEFFF